MKSKILVIEDNPDTRRFLQVMLGREFTVITAQNGLEGVALAKSEKPALVLMDVVMPALNGFDACQQLKSDPNTMNIPVIFLSGKNTATEIHYGLSQGADDYLPKPFDHQELLHRIKTKLDRKNAGQDVIKCGKLEIRTVERSVLFNEKEVVLTLTEFDLLRLLVIRRGVIVSREDIMKEIWKSTADRSKERTIDVHIRSIRRKIPELEQNIQSIYGVGYQLTL